METLLAQKSRARKRQQEQSEQAKGEHGAEGRSEGAAAGMPLYLQGGQALPAAAPMADPGLPGIATAAANPAELASQHGGNGTNHAATDEPGEIAPSGRPPPVAVAPTSAANGSNDFSTPSAVHSVTPGGPPAPNASGTQELTRPPALPAAAENKQGTSKAAASAQAPATSITPTPTLPGSSGGLKPAANGLPAAGSEAAAPDAHAASAPADGSNEPTAPVADTPAADHEPVAVATDYVTRTDAADSDAPAPDAIPTGAPDATAEPGDVTNPELGVVPEPEVALEEVPSEKASDEVDSLVVSGGVAEVDEAEPAEAASMADFHAAVTARAAAVPRPTIARGGGGVATAAATREEVIRFTESTVPDAAAELMPPVPEGMTVPPEAAEGNPVPEAIARVEETSGQTLPEQGFVVLSQTPLGNTPRLGARPVSADQLRAAHHVLEEGLQMSMPNDPRQPLIDLRERMLNPEPVAPTASGETTLVPHPHTPVPTPTPAARTQMAHVFARLLARPQAEAQDMVGRARTAAFPGGALDRELPGYGDDPHVANLAEELNSQYRDIARQAGVVAGDLDQAIANRRTVLEEEELAAREELMSSTTDASTMVCTAHDDLSSTIASEAERINTTADAVSAASTGETHTDHIHATRDRLLAQVTRRAGEIDAAYRRAKEDRDRELDTMQTQRIDAYRAAAQVDDFQLNAMTALPAERQTRLREIYTSQTRSAPSQESGLSQLEINTLVAASNAWANERAVMVRTAVHGFKQTVTESTNGWRTATSDAADASREQIRRWDESESGESRSWWDDLWTMVNDWVAQAHANTEAWQSQLNQQHAAEVVTDLNLIERLARAADRGITAEQEAELNSLTGDHRQIVQAFFRARSEGRSVDPITMVVDLTRARIWNERRANLISRIEDTFLADNEVPYAIIGQVVGRDVHGLASNLYAAFHGNWSLLSEAGTDEDAVFAALDGLNRVQSLALRNVYRRRYGVSLDSEVRDELSGGERDRAEALLSGNRAEAAAAALYSAMHETFLGTGAGTDEDTIHNTLRGLNAEERAEVTRIYRERYGHELATDTRGELDDWATVGTWDADRAEAELAGNLQLADAIEIDQELSGSWFHSSTTTTVASVYERVRREVQAQATRENRDSAWMEAEISRRTADIEREYNGRYAETSGTLDEAIDAGTRSERLFWGSTPENERASADYLHALSRNDMATADAARIRIERTSLTYADDDVINATVGSQYDRALVAERLDYAPERRRALMAELDARERASGQVMTAAERWAGQQEIERTIEREMIVRARGVASTNLDRMESEYSHRYRESARTAILDSTSGVTNEQAQTLLNQGGYLDPYQTFDYATRGVGTNEGAVTRAFAGLTREEIAQLDARWQREHDGETLREAAASEMSGREWLDVDIALDGAAVTIDDQIAQMRRRVEFERPTNGVGALLATEERAVMEAQLAHLEAMAARMHEPPPGSDAEAQRRARDGMLADFDTQNALMQETIEHHRQRSDAMVDSITTVVGIVVAVVVGAVGSIFTGGAAGAVALAIIASLCSTAATIGTKALLKGNAYGWEDIAVDIGVGLVDAVVAALTAGMGDRLLGLARPAGAGAVRSATATGLRGAWQRGVGALNRGAAHLGEQGLVSRGLRPNGVLQRMVSEEASLLSRGAAHAMAQTAENFVQSLPSTAMAVALDDNTWSGPGNPLVNLISGTTQGLGPGLAMGLGFSGAGAGFGHIRGALAMPRLGVDTHLRLPERVAPGTPEYHARMTEWQVTHPGRPEAEFQAHIDREFHGAMREAVYQQAVRREVATQLEDAMPPGDRALAAELPVTVVSDLEFRRMNNWRGGDATVVVRDGQVHVVVREGASPHAVRAQLEAHMGTLRNVEPGSGGRVGDPRAALPRDLRGRLPVDIDPELPPRTVRVEHDPVPRIVVGPGARAADIRLHVETARNVLQLHGAYGRVRHLLDGFADWSFLHGEPTPGTRAWEARQELRKLPDIIEARMREASSPDLTIHQRTDIEADVAHLREQLATHTRTLAEMDLSPGRGFVAAEGRVVPPRAELDAAHQRWLDQMRAAIRGEGPPPLPWRGPEPQLDAQGTWRGHDPAEAYAAYRRALSEGGNQYEAILTRDRMTGEYHVMLGREDSVAPPAGGSGRFWETVMHFHPNAEGALRYTLPAQQDLHLAMKAFFADAHPGGTPHVEFVESIINGERTRVAIVVDAHGMHLEIGRGAGGVDGPVSVSEVVPIGKLDDYLVWWRTQHEGTSLARRDPTEDRWVPPESQAYRDLMRSAARTMGDPKLVSRIEAGAPEHAGIPAAPHTMAGEAGNTPTVPDGRTVAEARVRSREGREGHLRTAEQRVQAADARVESARQRVAAAEARGADARASLPELEARRRAAGEDLATAPAARRAEADLARRRAAHELNEARKTVGRARAEAARAGEDLQRTLSEASAAHGEHAAMRATHNEIARIDAERSRILAQYGWITPPTSYPDHARIRALDAQIEGLRARMRQQVTLAENLATWRTHEGFVSASLREQNPGTVVAEQVRLEVTLSNGRRVLIVPDNLVQTGPDTFRIVDAKFSESASIARHGSTPGYTRGQTLAYPEIANGDIRSVRVVSENSANKIGLSDGDDIQLDTHIEIHTNNPDGSVRVMPYAPPP
jgi:hypothetical protein